jgi:hypothetical protein
MSTSLIPQASPRGLKLEGEGLMGSVVVEGGDGGDSFGWRCEIDCAIVASRHAHELLTKVGKDVSKTTKLRVWCVRWMS